MKKNLAASIVAAALMLVPASAQSSGSGGAAAPAASTSTDAGNNAGGQTNVDVDVPSAPAAPSVNTESTTIHETNRVTEVGQNDDHNWGIIVGAGLIGLTVLALLLNSRRTA